MGARAGTVVSVGEAAAGGGVELRDMGGGGWGTGMAAAAAAPEGRGSGGMLPRPSMGEAGDWTTGRREIWGADTEEEKKPGVQEGKTGGE